MKNESNINPIYEFEIQKEEGLNVSATELSNLKLTFAEKLCNKNSDELLNQEERKKLFEEFSEKITDMFPEIGMFQNSEETASEFSPKPLEVEHRKTIASIYYLSLLTSEDSPIEDKSDFRYKLLVPTFFQEKFEPEILEEQRQVIKHFLPEKEHFYMMVSMLAIHDLAKIQSVAEKIEQIREANEEEHTTDHDIALQSLLNEETVVQDELPTLSKLPKDKQEFIKKILRTGSEINIGQIMQGLEGNPRRFASIENTELTSEELGFLFLENLADTASAAGVPDGSALVMSQEQVWNAWKWSIESLQNVKEGKDAVEVYLDLLDRKAESLGFTFDRENDSHIVALRISMALQTTDKSVVESINKFSKGENGQVLQTIFGIESVTGNKSYRLYYSPSILRKINDISGLETSLEFLSKIGSKCLENSHNKGFGEITYQLSQIDEAINPKEMDKNDLSELLNKGLEIDENLYVRFSEISEG